MVEVSNCRKDGNAIESLLTPVSSTLIKTSVGYIFLPSFNDVIAIMVTTGNTSFASSVDIISTGLLPACSESLSGSRFA